MASTTPTRPARTRKPAAPVTTVVGTMGTRTAQAQPVKATPAPAKPAPARTPKAATTAKPVPASRALPRELIQVVAAHFANHSPADRQRIANYLKVVTSGTNDQGDRWWDDASNLPRPTHFSWASTAPAKPAKRTARKRTA